MVTLIHKVTKTTRNLLHDKSYNVCINNRRCIHGHGLCLSRAFFPSEIIWIIWRYLFKLLSRAKRRPRHAVSSMSNSDEEDFL